MYLLSLCGFLFAFPGDSLCIISHFYGLVNTFLKKNFKNFREILRPDFSFDLTCGIIGLLPPFFYKIWETVSERIIYMDSTLKPIPHQIKEALFSYIDDHFEEMIADLMDLIRIPSVQKEAADQAPFGPEVARCFSLMEEIAQKYHYSPVNCDNYVLCLDDPASPKEPLLDILAHLDVVPAGNDWTVTSPFEPVIADHKEDGPCLFGRGSSDDKGPALAALLAMRAIRSLNLPLKGRLRLILGGNEETGSADIAHYYQSQPEAPYTFSPDAEFPVINGEKGIMHMSFEKSFSDTTDHGLVLAFAGQAANMIPGKAHCVLKGISRNDAMMAYASFIDRFDEAGSVSMSIAEAPGQVISLTFKGTAGHASTPDPYANALTAMLSVLSDLLCDTEISRSIKTLSSFFPYGENHGRGLDLYCTDPLSGDLTLTFNVFSYQNNRLSATLDARIPLGGDDLPQKLSRLLGSAGFSVCPYTASLPHYVPADSDFVSSLMACYEEVTGKKEKPLFIGGGTYVHELKRGLAFGCCDVNCDTHMHGPDEFMPLKQLKLGARIYALAIYRLCIQ